MKRLLCLLLIASLLLACSGATNDASSTASAAAPTAEVAVTSAPAPTPTASPVPVADAVLGLYAAGSSLLRLEADGSFTLEWDGEQRSGTFVAQGSTLSLLPASGHAFSVAFRLQDDALQLEFANGTTLVLERIASSLLPHSRTELAAQPESLLVSIDGGVVTAYEEGLTHYCFTGNKFPPDEDAPDWLDAQDGTLCDFKMDGAYWLHLSYADGSRKSRLVCVDTDYVYISNAEGLAPLTQSLAELLTEQGSSIDAFNSELFYRVANAGLYTPQGVAVAAVYLVSKLADNGVTVPYYANGTYQAEEDWGADPAWGGLLNSPIVGYDGVTYRRGGVHCVGALMWAYKQAGINVTNELSRTRMGLTGSVTRLGDNEIPKDEGKAGDIITTKTGHSMMILDRMDTDGNGRFDSYLTLEMTSPNMTFHIHTPYSIRLCTLYDMRSVFQNTGVARKDSRIWPDTYFIPSSAFPALLTEALLKSADERGLRFLWSLIA